jgi:hypothetical protein
MNVLDDIRTWLISSSTGTKQIGEGLGESYPVYKLQKPASTANMSILYQSGGPAPDDIYELAIDNPGLQIVTLSAATSDLGYNQALKVQNRLRHVSNMKLPTSTGSYYVYIMPVQSPIGLGLDDNMRMQWSQNFSVKVSYD